MNRDKRAGRLGYHYMSGVAASMLPVLLKRWRRNLSVNLGTGKYELWSLIAAVRGAIILGGDIALPHNLQFSSGILGAMERLNDDEISYLATRAIASLLYCDFVEHDGEYEKFSTVVVHFDKAPDKLGL